MTTAAIYCRISQDTEGEALGVARQEEDCRTLAERQGLAVVGVYTDNDRGASTRSRKKVRPQYQAMLTAARAGELDVIVAYSNSRLTRRPAEFEQLIALYEQTGVRIVTAVSGEDDLSTADGRLVARIKASMDAAEAERTSERVMRKHLEIAQSGRPVGGTRPFGWLADRTTLDPAESAAIRKAAQDVIEGVPLRAVAQTWNAAGLTTPWGNQWDGRTVRVTLTSPRLAGWRVHQGKIALGKDGQPIRGLWEPALDQETADGVVAALTRPDNRSRVPRRGARHYLLTGLLRCGVCNGPMYGNKVKVGFVYSCQSADHGNSGSGPGIDEVVAAMVLARLANLDLTAPATPAEPEVGPRLEAINEQIAELMAAFRERRLSGGTVFAAVERLEAERDALRKQQATGAKPAGPRLTQMTPEAWSALDTDRQRAIAEQLFEAVLLRPATTRGNKFDVTRVEPVWAAAQ